MMSIADFDFKRTGTMGTETEIKRIDSDEEFGFEKKKSASIKSTRNKRFTGFSFLTVFGVRLVWKSCFLSERAVFLASAPVTRLLTTKDSWYQLRDWFFDEKLHIIRRKKPET